MCWFLSLFDQWGLTPHLGFLTILCFKMNGHLNCFLPSMLSSKQTWQKDKVPVSVSSLQTLQILSSFRSMLTNCSSSSMMFLMRKKQITEKKSSQKYISRSLHKWQTLFKKWVTHKLMLFESKVRWKYLWVYTIF